MGPSAVADILTRRWPGAVLLAVMAVGAMAWSAPGAPAAPAVGCTLISGHTASPGPVRLGDTVHISLTVEIACDSAPLTRHFIVAVPAWADGLDSDAVRGAVKAFAAAADAESREVGLVLGHESPPVEVPLTRDPATLDRALDDYGPAPDGAPIALMLGAGRAMFYDNTDSGREHLILLDHGGVPRLRASRLRFELDATLELGIAVTHICVAGGCPILQGVERIDVPDTATLAAALTPIAARPAVNEVQWITVRQRLGPVVDYVFPSANVDPTAMGSGGVAGDFIEWTVENPGPGVAFEFDVRPFATGPVVVAERLDTYALDSTGASPLDSSPALEPVDVLAEAATPSTCHMLGSASADPPAATLGDVITSTLVLATDCPAVARDVDVVLAFDQSSSMQGLPADAMTEAAESFLDRIDLSRSRVAVIGFSSDVEVRTDLTSDRDVLLAAVQDMTFYGDTALEKALDTSRGILRARRPTALPAVVLLTDGKVRDEPVAAAAFAKAAGIRIALVCFSPDQDCDQEVFDVASSQYLFFARDGAELIDAYDTLGQYLSAPDIERLSVTHVPSDALEYTGAPGHKSAPLVSPAGQLVWNRADPLLGRTILQYPLHARGVGDWPLAEDIVAFWVDSAGGAGGVRVSVPRVPLAAPAPEGPCTSESNRSAEPTDPSLGDMVTVTTILDVACPPSRAKIDVVFAIDHSFSMGTLNRLDNAVAAVESFLDEVSAANVWTGLVAFNEGITDQVTLGEDPDRVLSVLQGLRADGSTDIGRAIDASAELLAAGRPNSERVMVVLTDGENSPSGVPILEAAGRAVEAGILLVAVCAGGRCEPELEQAASGPQYYYNVGDEEDLSELFGRLGKVLVGLRPSGFWVEEQVPSAFRPVDGNPMPKITQGRIPKLEWQFGAPGETGITFKHRLEPLAVGLRPVALWSRVRYTMQGGAAGLFYVPPAEVTVAGGPVVPLPTAGPPPTPSPEPTEPAPLRTVFMPALPNGPVGP